MVKQVLVFVFLILIAASAAFSQTTEQQVTKIRAIYAETNKRIETGLKDKTSGFHYAAWTVGGKGDGQAWAAVGTMETRDEIWFEGGDDAGEEENPAIIRKIVSSYKGAADLHSRTEYFFDESGELIFIFASSDLDSENGKMIERRFYYSSGRLLRVTRGGKNTDANFSAKDLEESSEESAGAKQMQKRFAELLGK
jgi:hypothetical protein